MAKLPWIKKAEIAEAGPRALQGEERLLFPALSLFLAGYDAGEKDAVPPGSIKLAVREGELYVSFMYVERGWSASVLVCRLDGLAGQLDELLANDDLPWREWSVKPNGKR